MLSGYNRNFFFLHSHPFLLHSSLPLPSSPSPLPCTKDRDEHIIPSLQTLFSLVLTSALAFSSVISYSPCPIPYVPSSLSFFPLVYSLMWEITSSSSPNYLFYCYFKFSFVYSLYTAPCFHASMCCMHSIFPHTSLFSPFHPSY